MKFKNGDRVKFTSDAGEIGKGGFWVSQFEKLKDRVFLFKEPINKIDKEKYGLLAPLEGEHISTLIHGWFFKLEQLEHAGAKTTVQVPSDKEESYTDIWL